MPPRADRVSIARLRAALALRVAETSRRRTADEVGLSPQGLGNFLAGASPHPSTIHKMERWYADYADSTPPKSLPLLEALEALVAPLPLEERGSAMQELRGFLVGLLRRRGCAVPPELSSAS